MSRVFKKKVIIKEFKPLWVLKGINGPILTPVELSTDDIMHCLNVKYDMYEVEDGFELKLTKDNYLKDNTEEFKKLKEKKEKEDLEKNSSKPNNNMNNNNQNGAKQDSKVTDFVNSNSNNANNNDGKNNNNNGKGQK